MVLAGVAIVTLWAIALTAYAIARSFKITPEKLAARLADTKRPMSLEEIARQFNALDQDGRRDLRMNEAMRRWFDALSEVDKARFMELTLPTGFKRMINAFEEMPPDKRKKALDDAYKRMRAAQAEARDPGAALLGQSKEDAQKRPPMSEEVRQKMFEVGLSTFYNESSAQTKAEVMPLLEELQRTMQKQRRY
jgi:hypothetical protein